MGRDTAALPRDGIVRATIESLSENLTDGVLTPLWALCLFGLPGLVVVRAVSSLDSMVGHKNARYQRFGWAGARSDDLAHWLPARLSVPLVAAAAACCACIQDRRSGPRGAIMPCCPAPTRWSEAACAGALRVRLLRADPLRRSTGHREAFMGDADWPADLDGADLRRALRLILVCDLLAVAIGLTLIRSEVLML